MPRKALDKEMNKIERDIWEMTELVSEAVSKALVALENNDKKLGCEVIVGDELINNYQTQIRRRSIQAIALQQPVAKDLRFISISIDVAYNLERIGDYAKDIAETLNHMNGEYPTLKEIREMGKLAAEMVKDTGDAFVHEKKDKIAAVMQREDRVDELHRSLFPILKKGVEKCKGKCSNALNLILISKFIERIGDHSVNIADRAMYRIHGKNEYL